MSRWLVVLSLGVLLAACSNQVYSERPLIKNDRRLAAEIRKGAWAAPEAGCAFDARQPVEAWPDCAHGYVEGMFPPGSQAVAGAGPILVQYGDRRARRTTFWFAAFEPVARDADGHIVEVESWTVLCGPPPPPRTDPDGTVVAGGVTPTPMPGLEVIEQNCRADDLATVREAARRSRAWDPDVIRARWVRD